MKHAFLIIAHNNWVQIKQVLKAMDYKDVDFYIHVNSKVDEPDKKEFQNLCNYSKIIFSDRVPIIWGDFGICNASLVLLDCARKNKEYDYYHLLTGSCLPLLSMCNLDKWFEKNRYENLSKSKMTNYIEASVASEEMSQRVSLYNFCVPLWGNKNAFIRKIGTGTDHLLRIIQKLIGVNRFKSDQIVIYKGSPWWSLSNEFVEYVISKKQWIEERFSKNTFAADEYAIQTVLMNSVFRDTVFEPQNGENKNLRLIDFNGGNGYGSPRIWKIKDKERINTTTNLFARKFDMRIDEDIIDMVLEKIKEN